MCRRIGLAKTLMDDLEGISDARDCKFVDLYVRRQNKQAIRMYERLGYYVHEVVKDYYQGFDDPNVTEDAFDMHKLLEAGLELIYARHMFGSTTLDYFELILKNGSKGMLDMSRT